MTTERKQWWRKVAAIAVGGSVVAGGLIGVRARAGSQEPSAPLIEDAAWSRSSAPAAPAVAEVDRRDAPSASSEGVVPAGAALPIPTPTTPSPVVPAVPTVPAIPAPPAPFPPNLEPVGAGPRAPEAGVGADKNLLPPVPSLPPIDLPKVPGTPTLPDTKPTIPVPPADLTLPAPVVPPTSVLPAPSSPVVPPALPPLPGEKDKADPQKVPTIPAPPAPVVPVVPPPAGIAPSLPPVQNTEPSQPMLPGKPDSGLNPAIPGNTLNPTPIAPAVPAGFPPTSPGGRDVPALPTNRSKPPEPSFGSTDKSAFPAPAGNPLNSTPRDTAMLNFKQTAALAVLGGAMLTAEQARSAPPVVPMIPTVPVKADEKTETQKLKEDLIEANKKIATLEKQIEKLNELLTGRKDIDGKTILPSDPGAIANIKELKDEIAKLKLDLKSMSSTSQKPAIVPEAKPRGIVKVVNEYPVEISMVINEKSHRIAPSTKIEVEVPAGDFTYQLLQSGAAATRSVIKDKETVTLRIK
ncbi:unnamed protein product [Gemmata massiliana]|uniref:Uncharacterized protein n=1 Tax=Gemmata massiliana TaxID=1210884 RepID=A0A6P2D0S4_9BACT|nr:hypothetical protein [Gemmata massiliana]VTR94729.1 unnamed protein product [Gemmata massiliana]